MLSFLNSPWFFRRKKFYVFVSIVFVNTIMVPETVNRVLGPKISLGFREKLLGKSQRVKEVYHSVVLWTDKK